MRMWCTKCSKWVISHTHQKDHVQFLKMRGPVKQTGGESEIDKLSRKLQQAQKQDVDL